jgi:hypothetical protein
MESWASPLVERYGHARGMSCRWQSLACVMNTFVSTPSLHRHGHEPEPALAVCGGDSRLLGTLGFGLLAGAFLGGCARLPALWPS